MPDVELHQKTYPVRVRVAWHLRENPQSVRAAWRKPMSKPTLESAPYTPPALNVTLNCHKFAFHVEADTVDEFRAKV